MSTIADLPPFVIDNAQPMSGGFDLDLNTGGLGVEQTTNVIVAWGDLDAFLTIAAGTVSQVGGPFGPITRVIPLFHPTAPNLLCSSAKWQAIPPVVETPDHLWGTYPNGARVSIGFSSVPYDTDGDMAFLSDDLDFGGSFRTLPGSSYKWSDDNKPVDQDIGIFVPEVAITMTAHRVATVNYSLLLSLDGKVNTVPFLPKTYNCPAGTVLFTGAKAKRSQQINGKLSREISYSFAYSPVPWQQLMKPDGTGFKLVVRADGSGQKIYGEDDLNKLFKAS